MLALYLLATIATMTVVETLLPGYERFGAPVGLAASGLATAWLATRYLDRRPLRSLGLSLEGRWWREVAAGLLVGLFLTGGVFAIYLAAGWATVEGWFVAGEDSFLVGMGLVVATTAAIGLLEELLFRGHFVTNATEGVPSRLVAPLARVLPRRWLAGVPVTVAVAVSSLVFADFHGDSLTALEYLHFWLAGVLLAVPYVLTGRLGVSIGIHWAFNAGLTGIFNVESGAPSLVDLSVSGPSLWVGEAALVETAMIALTLALLVLWARWRGLAHLDPTFRRESGENERSVLAD